MIKSNGGIIGPDNVTTGGAFGTASGVFKLGEVTNLIKESKWPTPGPQGFQVANSCRFNDDSSDYLSSTFGSTTNRKTFTLSFWVKKSKLGADQRMIEASTGTDGNNVSGIESDPDRIRVIFYNEPTVNINLKTNALLRDISAWYHIVLAIDTTQGTASNRAKLYVNGVQQTSFDTATYPNQNVDTDWNLNNNNIRIGRRVDSSPEYYDGYMAEVVSVDGQALAPTSFGEFNSQTGIWVPKVVTGLTFGNNGFYLPFTNSGALGEDFSGNDNDFTVNNLTSIDQTTDTPTTNFITLNPLIGYTSQTDNQVYSEGNTIIIPNSTDNYGTGSSTIGLKGGKWYWEAQIVWNGTSNNANFPRTIGFCTENYLFNYSYLGQDGESWGIIFADASPDIWRLEHGGSSGDISGATTMANGGTMNLALDLDNGKFYVGYNGTFFTSGDPTSGATGTGAIATLDATDLSKYIFPTVTNATNSTYYKFNFGNPAYAISSGNTDGNGFGNFEYAVPTGYLSLNTKNLAAVLA